MKIIKLFQMGLVLSAITLSSCRPGGAEYIDELDMVGTAYSKEADFSSKHTYARPDSIVKVEGSEIIDPDGNGRPDYINMTYANIITSQIDQNMKAYGWTKVAMSANPDVFIQLAAMENTQVYYYYSSWYWGYGGYYGGWGGWYYPGYYPPTYTTTKTGTLLMQMAAPADSTLDGKIPVLWTGIVNGMMEGSSTSFTSRAKKSIDQAFKQSPILKK